MSPTFFYHRRNILYADMWEINNLSSIEIVFDK